MTVRSSINIDNNDTLTEIPHAGLAVILTETRAHHPIKFHGNLKAVRSVYVRVCVSHKKRGDEHQFTKNMIPSSDSRTHME